MIRILLLLAILLAMFVLNGCPNSDGGDGAVTETTTETETETEGAEEGY